MTKLSRTSEGQNERSVRENTGAEKILLAAFHLEEMGQSPFSAESLIVAAWQNYPRAFGLRSYEEQYPDSNKVLAYLMGEKGLARRGWLIKMGQKLYALSHEGRRAVSRILRRRSDCTCRLTKKQDKLLCGLFVSSAYEKFREGRQQGLKFSDACRFWGIDECPSPDAINARLDHVRAELAEIERRIGLGSADLRDGRAVTLDDISRLCDLHTHLLQRFARHLALLRNRMG